MALSKLESMPTELHIIILEQLPDINSLSALVHASPVIYKAYSIARETILTKVIVREVLQRMHHIFCLLPLGVRRSGHQQQRKSQASYHVAGGTSPVSETSQHQIDNRTL